MRGMKEKWKVRKVGRKDRKKEEKFNYMREGNVSMKEKREGKEGRQGGKKER